MTVNLFIGADNDTGKLDLPHINGIVARNHQEFTSWTADGFWRGHHEPMAIVLISDEQSRIEDTVRRLKSELHQEAIGVQRMPEMELA